MGKILGICIPTILLGGTILILVIISSPHHITAQTLESIQRSTLNNKTQITLGINPKDIAIDETLNKVYVTDVTTNSLSVLDSNSGMTKNIRFRSIPSAIAIDPDSHKVYVAQSGNTVSVLDGFNNNKEAKDIRVGLGPRAIAVGINVYVANSLSGTVSVIDRTTNTNIKNITVGADPSAIAYGLSGLVYVANSGSNTVSVINETTNTNIKNITVGAEPSAIAEVLGEVYVINSGIDSNTVSAVNKTTYAVTNIAVGVYSVSVYSECQHYLCY
jgi:YVTN family beta-propeller protein